RARPHGHRQAPEVQAPRALLGRARAEGELTGPGGPGTALGELRALFAAIEPDGEREEEHRVAPEPQQAHAERLMSRAERAPRELRVVVARQVGRAPLDEI